jgi:hypothetical protein
MAAKVSANVRMYRLNELGDCFLVTFASESLVSRLLIDCGSFRNGAPSIKRLERITGQIRKAAKGHPLDVIVGTHQHNDHVSGFVHCEQAFREIGVRQVWLSWLDDPSDPQAQSIGDDFKNLKLHLAAARDTLHASSGSNGRSPVAARSLEILDDMLGFDGAAAAGTPPELPARGVKILKEISGKKPEYLRPGRTLDMPGLPAGAVRVHVLGPPRKEELLYRKDPRKGESYDHSLAARVAQATKFLEATRPTRGADSNSEEDYPFNQEYQRRGAAGSPQMKAIRRVYDRQGHAWRTIDDDWMQQAETLALFLDTYTNNSSLALAIELVASDKVLLFAADAQTGNWLSWKNVKWERPGVITDSLLARTVFYKVGHHASHNATLVETFERMSHPDLVAFIPVHKKDPNITKKNGWKMPARNLFKRLVKQTSNRVLQMDDKNPSACDPAVNPAKAAWKKIGIAPNITPDFIEIDIS